jgi:hypothetical protein
MSDADAEADAEGVLRRAAAAGGRVAGGDRCGSGGRTRQWVAKWAGRYDPEDPERGRCEAERTVRPMTVVMVDELGQHALWMSAVWRSAARRGTPV